MSEKGCESGRFDLAVFAPYRIAVLGREISERLGAAYANEGLTIPEWRVLAVVAQAPSVAARDVVAKTPMDKMAVSRSVGSLESKGLIARAPTTDRRVSSLSLTRRGRAVFDRVADIALAYEAALLSRLTEEERTAFFKGLHRLEAAVGSRSTEEAARAAE